MAVYVRYPYVINYFIFNFNPYSRFFRQKRVFVILLSYIRWLIGRDGCFTMYQVAICGWRAVLPIKKKLMKMLFLCGLLKSTPVLYKWDVVK